MRWIAEPRRAGRSLEHDRARVAVGEAFDARIFLAKAHAAREQYDRGLQLEAAKARRQCGGQRRRHSACGSDSGSGAVGIGQLLLINARGACVPCDPARAGNSPNTGNIIRLCANTGCRLHLIEPLGFELDRRSVRRAGLDYADLALVQTHASLRLCLQLLGDCLVYAIETSSARCYSEAHFAPGDALLFGSETRGLPEAALAARTPAQRLSIPMRSGNRSLNLSNAVAIVVYEAWRQQAFR